MSNESLSVLPSVARTAATTSSTFTNYAHHGAHVIVNVTVAATAGSITPTIQGFDEVTQAYYDLLVGAAITTTGVTVLKVYPGITAVANGSTSDFLPIKWRVSMAVATADSYTYTVSANLET